MTARDQRRGMLQVATLLGVGLMIGCGGGGSGAGLSPSPTRAAVANTPTPTPTGTPVGAATSTPAASGISVAEAIARNAQGAALLLNETVTTEGIVTVSAGILANNKLKVFMQDGASGIMVYHQSAADVPAFQAGDQLRVTGVIRQADPITDTAPAIGTILIDVTAGSWQVLSSGNPLPAPQSFTLQQIEMNGDAYVGSLVTVANVQKVSGDWPPLGSKSAQVTVSDDAGATTLVLRFQKNTITQQLVTSLTAIADGPFQLVGIVVQNDTTNDGSYFGDFEIWVRGADDINPTSP
ncbi:MAG TPA: hypothetical protein VN812_20090 [Candidatus Acidoferrales bacterium]|nr:hypothetical protein [Candidatus Acidoferrales bacterium]